MRKMSSIFIVLSATIVLFAFALEDDFVSRLQARLSSFYREHAAVKLHVFLNQPQYVPGDTMMYKITMVNDVMSRRVEGRQVIDLQLVSDLNETRFLASVLINNGTGAGALILPLSFPPGLYMLRAYHKTMLNAAEPLIFQQPLLIGGHVSLTSDRDVKLTFFPESGNVVEGVTCRMVVHASPLFSAAVFEDDKIITRVKCDSAGWGEFYFVPRESKKYYYGDTTSDRTIIPVSFTGDVSMLVSGVTEGAQLRIAVHSSGRGNYTSPLRLVCSHVDEILFSSSVDFKKKKSYSVMFPKANLRTGVYAITLFTESGDVVSERLAYIEKPSPLIVLSSDKDVYNVRETVKLSCSLTPGVDSRSLSVKVYQEDLFTHAGMEDISIKTYFNITAGLPDAVSSQFSLSGTSIDQFMISQKRQKFSWQEILSGGEPDEYVFEPYQRLVGKALFRTTGKPVPDSTFIQFFFEKEVAGYQAYTSDSGKFSFPLLFDFYDEDAVHYSAQLKGEELQDVMIVPEQVIFAPAPGQGKVAVRASAFGEFMEKKRLIGAAFDQSKPEILTDQVWLNARIESAVNGVDATYVMSDYILLSSMHETLLEIIPGVKSRGNKNLVRVWLAGDERQSDGDPLYVIDGVLTDDTEYFFSLNPADVVTIKVINTLPKLDVIGGVAKNGIILVDTKIPKHEQRIPRRINVFAVTGLTKTKVSRSWPRKKTETRTPDLRPCLYWNPDVEVVDGETNLTFPCADNTGKFRVVVQGLTTDGQVFTQSHSFLVTFKGQ